MKKILKYIFLLLLAAFVIIQFFPADKSVPEFDASGDFITMTQPDENVESILRISCYDCHSFETNYPWYSNIAPISWWLQGHIDHGRGEMNLSLWKDYEYKKADHKLEEMVEEVENFHMPITSYLVAHKEARMNPEKLEQLRNFVEKLRAEMRQEQNLNSEQ